MAADTPTLAGEVGEFAGERKLIAPGEYGAEGCGCECWPNFFPKNWENRWGGASALSNGCNPILLQAWPKGSSNYAVNCIGLRQFCRRAIVISDQGFGRELRRVIEEYVDDTVVCSDDHAADRGGYRRFARLLEPLGHLPFWCDAGQIPPGVTPGRPFLRSSSFPVQPTKP
ncbi:hypothetical protein KSP40_PGU018680 [Platanthera guangdongensis]|uniref:Uncharacterized protein n=1 Tax=Platanthera guangdongensis TaxID=2320717 RepID=A0ABR2LLR9_9ASPA